MALLCFAAARDSRSQVMIDFGVSSPLGPLTDLTCKLFFLL